MTRNGIAIFAKLGCSRAPSLWWWESEAEAEEIRLEEGESVGDESRLQRYRWLDPVNPGRWPGLV